MKTTMFTLAILMLLFSGCITKEKCYNRFPPQTIETVTTTIEVKETFKDTIIYQTLPGEIVILVDTVIQEKDGKINSKLSRLETTLAWSTAQIRNNLLFHELHQKDTTLEFRLNDAIREVERLEKELTLKTETVEVPRQLTKWQQFRLRLANISLVCLAFFSIYLLLKIKF
jgi:hypothetical protein